MMKNDIAIKVENVSKSFKLPHNRQSSLKGTLINLIGRGDRTYETQEVLKDISFEIKKGEFFGIVGRNGSGKSTLLKMIAGIYEPTKGSITINGSLTPFIELGVGFNPELTGRENVYMNGALLGFDNKEVDAMYDNIVEFAELERFMDQKLKNYSSGMQVRLAFSIAIRAQSDILVLDEVLAVGDAAFQQKCYEYFETLKAEKQTVIIVTHDMNAVKRFCTKAMLLSGGGITQIGTPQQVAEQYTELNIDNVLSDTTKIESTSKFIRYEVKPVKTSIQTGEDYSVRVQGKDIKEKLFVNMSLIYNGFVVADINSKYLDDDKYLGNDIELEVVQSTKGLNPGRYDIHLSLHRKSDDKLIEHLPRIHTFLIKGERDRSRGGPVRLDGEWHKVGGDNERSH